MTMQYTPPEIGQGEPATRYQYNLDKQLTGITRPGGETVTFTYHNQTGQLESLSIPRGEYQYGYNTMTGRLETFIAPDLGKLTYTYDGFLPTRTSWEGEITGAVTQSYNNDFRLSQLAVSAGRDPSVDKHRRRESEGREGSANRNPPGGWLMI